MSGAKLEVRDATFSYDGKRNIFEGISFTVEKGEVFSILGPNGTGKSTLLRCLCNLYRLSRGSIAIDDRDITKYGPAGLPQIHMPTFPYSVLEVVLMGRTPHLNLMASPSAKDYRIAEEAIETVNIGDIRDKPYTQLSGGQMQLVLMARVLAQEPEILLLDEPTSHLDVGNQMHTIDMIRKLAGKDLAIVVTSHFPDHTFMYSNKVGIMKDRRFIAVGPADDVVTEENLKATYGVDIRIVYMEGGINRKIAVPLV
jgi:iron complex transport system ATP-binding protein